MIQYNDNTNTQLGNAYILAYGAQEFRLSGAEAAEVAVPWPGCAIWEGDSKWQQPKGRKERSGHELLEYFNSLQHNKY